MAFGNYNELEPNKLYKADADGFVIGVIEQGGDGSQGSIVGLISKENPNQADFTVAAASVHSYNHSDAINSFTMPVSTGDLFRVNFRTTNKPRPHVRILFRSPGRFSLVE